MKTLLWTLAYAIRTLACIGALAGGWWLFFWHPQAVGMLFAIGVLVGTSWVSAIERLERAKLRLP